MKIDQSNALRVASIGAALWWILFGIPALYDHFSPHHSEKRFISALAIVFGSFCGLAFYICISPSAIKAVRINFRSHPARTSMMFAWSILPIFPILFASGLIFMKIFGIGNM